MKKTGFLAIGYTCGEKLPGDNFRKSIHFINDKNHQNTWQGKKESDHCKSAWIAGEKLYSGSTEKIMFGVLKRAGAAKAGLDLKTVEHYQQLEAGNPH